MGNRWETQTPAELCETASPCLLLDKMAGTERAHFFPCFFSYALFCISIMNRKEFFEGMNQGQNCPVHIFQGCHTLGEAGQSLWASHPTPSRSAGEGWSMQLCCCVQGDTRAQGRTVAMALKINWPVGNLESLTTSWSPWAGWDQFS